MEINKPEGDSAIDYFSRKQKYTILTQAICNGNLIFLAVDAGLPGHIHDSRMLEHSWIGKAVADDTFLKSNYFWTCFFLVGQKLAILHITRKIAQ